MPNINGGCEGFGMEVGCKEGVWHPGGSFNEGEGCDLGKEFGMQGPGGSMSAGEDSDL